MKKTVQKIGKVILIYVLAIVILNGVSAFFLNIYLNNKYFDALIITFGNQIPQNGEVNYPINFIIIFKDIVEGIALAILASFIFTHLLNREPKIIFPEKLVLRRRTSEGSEGKLVLGILIGNPNKKLLYDIKCNVNCVYLKHDGDIIQRNGETYLNYNVDFMQNYFRFSFDIKDFPKTFWKHYLEKNEKYIDNDFLRINISGKMNGLGGCFRVNHDYFIQDIIVDTHEPEKRFKKKNQTFFTGKEKIKIDWKEFPKYIEAGEDERRNIISEIYDYCYCTN